MPEAWVINASPVILLAKAGLIGHVPLLADPLVIPAPVAAEVSNAPGDDEAVRWLTNHGTRFIRPATREVSGLSATNIGAGERAVISWAVAHPDFVAVLDDAEARIAAQQLGVGVVGTVGVVLRLKNAGLISDVKSHLLKLKRVGGYISDELFNDVLRRADEEL